MTDSAQAASVAADYFDGTSAQARRVRLEIDASGRLHIEGSGVDLVVARTDVQWPERSRHGARIAHLRGGGTLYALDAGAWDAWARAAGLAESPVVAAQQSWRGTAITVVLLLVLAAAGYVWGVPWLGRSALSVLPLSADTAIGSAALSSFEGTLLLPSQVPPARQQALRAAFARAVTKTYADGGAPAYELNFRASPKLGGKSEAAAGESRTQLGPNAFALPGGIIVVTDDMVSLMQGRDDVMMGVLGHELGHVRRRHGMRMVVQAMLIGAATTVAWGDFSSVLAAAPALLGQRAYSRDFEREADTDAIRLLRANGIPPSVMVELFDRLAAYRQRIGKSDDGFDLGISLASHPADAERMQGFREASRP